MPAPFRTVGTLPPHRAGLAVRAVRAFPSSLAAALAVASCSSSTGSSVHLPAFQDVYAAPAPIQQAARAVVRIQTAGEAATGSFISSTGLLITNNHVLGVGICPVEGCYAQLTFNFQRKFPFTAPVSVFVVPKAVDIGLDMAVVQVYATDKVTQYASPDFLNLVSRSPTDLLGTRVNVVGHPEGHLKKWTQGEVVDTSGDWITFSAYALPGNSGSPLLDEQGQMVGILHRGPSSQDLISGNGVDEYSIGTASASLMNAISAATTSATGSSLPPTMWSLANSGTDDDVVAHQDVYLNAHASSAMVAGASKMVIDSLGAACDAGLAIPSVASPDQLAANLNPCFEALLWINCVPSTSGAFSVCPTDTAAWSTRFQGVNQAFVNLNGQLQLSMVSSGPASLAADATTALATGSTLLGAALAATNPPLDFEIADYLASFGVLTYRGQGLAGFTRGYAHAPGYQLVGDWITATAAVLAVQNALTKSEATSIAQALLNDPTVDIGSKLYIEESLYESYVIQ